ncbi:MAG TPA: hypothetical protein VF054_06000 [Micromonosporaceae bacterium]
MSGRRMAIGGALSLAVITGIVGYSHRHSVVDGLLAALAGLIAGAVAAFAFALPGLTLRGLVIGLFFVTAGMLSWTYIDTGLVVWVCLAIEGVLFAVWSFPWLRDLARLPRLGAAWLGLAYWVLGVIGAALVWHPVVAVERVAYAGVFGLAALAVVATVRRRGAGDPTIGITSAFLLAIAALLASGSGNLFHSVHTVPGGPAGEAWAHHMQHRFWGGSHLLYHPNSLAVIAVVVAARIGPSRRFPVWQRVCSLLLLGFILYMTNSRTGLVYTGMAALVHAFLLLKRRGADLPEYSTRRRTWLAIAAPFVIVVAVFVASGATQFLLANRYGSSTGNNSVEAVGTAVTSGRLQTWKTVGREWWNAGFAEKAFGSANDARATVSGEGRTSAGVPPKLTTDNAAVGALRRGGVLGEIAFLAGLVMLLVHATVGPRLTSRRDDATGPRGAPAVDGARFTAFTAGRLTPPAWFTATVIGAVPTIATADWLLGGTGGTLWILLLAAEAFVVFGAFGAQPGTPAETDSVISAEPVASMRRTAQA